MGAKTIMLIGDEVLIALDLSSQLEDERYEVLSPFKTAGDALVCLDKVHPDAALLDFNLSGEQTGETVADRLAELAVPFAFLTGYASTKLTQDSRSSDRPILAKPPAIDDLRRMLDGLLSGKA